jgi:hypothetical protein
LEKIIKILETGNKEDKIKILETLDKTNNLGNFKTNNFKIK